MFVNLSHSLIIGLVHVFYIYVMLASCVEHKYQNPYRNGERDGFSALLRDNAAFTHVPA